MPIGATIGAAVIGGGASILAGSKAAHATTKAADQSIGEQRREYDQSRADLAPWRNTGGSALDTLSRFYGLNGQAPDQSVFTDSPGYQYRFNEGIRGIDRGAAARGLLHSGAAVKAEENMGQGLASQEVGNWTNTLLGLSGAGQNATNTGVAAGQNSANAISQAYGNAGNARASSYANIGSSINSGINNVLFSYLNGFGGSKAPNYGGGGGFPSQMWGF
jgi:hypothetical protein